MDAHETAEDKTDKIPGPQPSPSSGADRWRRASMTISDGKNYSQGWAITQSAWCEREQRRMGNQGHPLREEAWVQAWTVERSPIPKNWGEKPLRQRWQLEQRTRGWKRKKKGQLCQRGLCSELKSERMPDGYLAWLDLLMRLYAMRFSLLLTWLQELLNPAASLVHVFHYYHDPCFNNLLIFSIPCAFF